MALLNYFGELNEGVLYDYRFGKKAIDAIFGLTLFKIVEEQLTHDSITLVAYEKSFWSKKQKGYIKLEYIEDVQPNTLDFRFSDGYGLPPYSDILIGFEFWSIYDRIYSPKLFKSIELGQPRKEVLSLGVLLNHIQINLNSFSNATLDILTSDQDWTSDDFQLTFKATGSLSDVYHVALQKLKVFEKYKARSKQPTEYIPTS